MATTIGVSGALLVCTILGDWTRYISSELHSPSRLAWIGSLGIFIGFVVPAAIGAAVTTAFTDPAAPFTVGVANDSPLWYAVLLLPFAVFGGVGLVAQSLYSAGLDLEAVVVRLTRARATVIIARDRRRARVPRAAPPTVQAATTAAFIAFAELARAVGDDRRHRLPAHPRPLRRRRPAGVQPPSHRRPLLVLRGLELAGRAGVGRRVASSGC